MNRGGQTVHANRTAVELVDDRPQQIAIDLVESLIVDLEQLQGIVRHVHGNPTLRPDLGEVADSTKQTVRDPWRAARAARELAGGVLVEWNAENTGRAAHNLLDVTNSVEVQAVHDAETGAQRSRQQSGTGRGADQGELLQRNLHRSRTGSLADHDVQLVVLHRRIENFFDGWREPVNLVDEQDLVFLEVGQHAGKVPRLLDRRAGRGGHRHAHLVRNHERERRLAEAWRPVQQHMIERFAALAGGRD